MNKQKVIAIISARMRSKGLPGKNLRLIAGKPLVAHTIEHALSSGVCDVVLVTTEDERLAQAAWEYGAEVPFMRPPALAEDFIPIEPVIQHALLTYESRYQRKFDIVVYLQTTDIFRSKDVIRECVQRLIANPNLDSVFSAYETHKNLWRKTPKGFVQLSNEVLYREDTGIACATRAYVIREGKRLGEKVDIVATDDPCTSIDIHNEFDLWLADTLYGELHR